MPRSKRPSWFRSLKLSDYKTLADILVAVCRAAAWLSGHKW